MKLSYRRSASEDVTRQFRYYLVTLNIPPVAVRFRAAVRLTVESLRRNPLIGPIYDSGHPQLKAVRSWPVAGFEAIRIYYVVADDTMQVIRVLHGKRDVRRLLKGE